MGAEVSKIAPCCGSEGRGPANDSKVPDNCDVPKMAAKVDDNSDSEEDESAPQKTVVQDSAAKQQCLHLFPQDPDSYEKKALIGEGGFGQVFVGSCEDMQGEAVALKILNLDDAGCDIMEVFNEVNLMCNIKHPNILDLHATFPVDDKLWMVMPFIRYGSVRQILDFAKPLAGSGGFTDEKLIATIMKQCLEALNYCHSQPQPIIHRDVKAANILINDEGHSLLMDFGVSKSLESNAVKSAKPKLKRTNSYVGTASWMAPEVSTVDINADGTCQSSSSYGTKADIWSFGITMMELAYGCPPHGNDGEAEFREFTTGRNSKPKKSKEKDFTASYRNLSVRDKMTAVQHGPVIYKNMKMRQKTMSKPFLKVIEQCLTIDPEERPSAQKLLKSTFFKKSAKDSAYVRKMLLSNIPSDYLANGGKSTAEQREGLKTI